MAEGPRVGSTEEAKGARQLGWGAVLGLVGVGLAIVVPLVFVWLATGHAGGFFHFGIPFVRTAGLLVVAGAALMVVSFVLYRRGFSHLQHADRRFRVASALCLVGSVGFVGLFVAGAIVSAQPGSTAGCLEDSPSHALACLRAAQPYGAYLGVAGFWLAWSGGVGLVVGFGLASARFERGELLAAAAVYAALLGVLVGPAAELTAPVPGARYLLLAGPVLSVIAPGFVLVASRGTFRPRGWARRAAEP